MLVVDEPFARFSADARKQAFEVLSRPENAFQTLAVSVSDPPVDAPGWTTVRLTRDSWGVRIQQDVP
ncbi:MAG: hypothetical protein Q8K55_05855, partial [Gemmatimonadaceae bacterium]|nr:hypothetical protein [Gemmatimonadaceae bacterium]